MWCVIGEIYDNKLMAVAAATCELLRKQFNKSYRIVNIHTGVVLDTDVLPRVNVINQNSTLMRLYKSDSKKVIHSDKYLNGVKLLGSKQQLWVLSHNALTGEIITIDFNGKLVEAKAVEDKPRPLSCLKTVTWGTEYTRLFVEGIMRTTRIPLPDDAVNRVFGIIEAYFSRCMTLGVDAAVETRLSAVNKEILQYLKTTMDYIDTVLYDYDKLYQKIYYLLKETQSEIWVTAPCQLHTAEEVLDLCTMYKGTPPMVAVMSKRQRDMCHTGQARIVYDSLCREVPYLVLGAYNIDYYPIAGADHMNIAFHNKLHLIYSNKMGYSLSAITNYLSSRSTAAEFTVAIVDKLEDLHVYLQDIQANVIDLSPLSGYVKTMELTIAGNTKIKKLILPETPVKIVGWFVLPEVESIENFSSVTLVDTTKFLYNSNKLDYLDMTNVIGVQLIYDTIYNTPIPVLKVSPKQFEKGKSKIEGCFVDVPSWDGNCIIVKEDKRKVVK